MKISVELRKYIKEEMYTKQPYSCFIFKRPQDQTTKAHLETF